jgi:hypothetical protein
VNPSPVTEIEILAPNSTLQREVDWFFWTGPIVNL